MKLEKCVAIVTGGASGLGEATVRNIVMKGGKAVIFDLNEDRGNNLAEELGENTLFVHVNVANEKSVESGIEATMNKYGSINTVVNCAGIGNPKKTVSRQKAMTLENFVNVINVNLIGTFNVLRLAAEKMSLNEPNENDERGVIVNTASIAAFEGQAGQAAYSASKAGIVGMTLPIARDLASLGIRVVSIAPGLFRTPLFETLSEDAQQLIESQTLFPSRSGKTSEFASLVQSIIENPMLNGETIRLDGGMRLPQN